MSLLSLFFCLKILRKKKILMRKNFPRKKNSSNFGSSREMAHLRFPWNRLSFALGAIAPKRSADNIYFFPCRGGRR